MSKTFNRLTKGLAAVGGLIVGKGGLTFTDGGGLDFGNSPLVLQGGVAPVGTSTLPSTLNSITNKTITVNVPAINALSESSQTISQATWASSTLNQGDLIVANYLAPVPESGLSITRAYVDGSSNIVLVWANANNTAPRTFQNGVQVQITHFALTPLA